MPAGHELAQWEQAQFDGLLADMFGFHAVQLGLAQWPTLRTNRMPYALVVEHGGEDLPADLKNALLVDDFLSLPFADDSLDLVVAPHAFEHSADPRQVLREIHRVLRPEGRLVMSGFNPVSLWGAQRMLGWRDLQETDGPWVSLPRLKDWFALLGLECQHTRHGVYRPCLRTERWLRRTRFLERAGDRWWPICGAVYIAVAVKRVPALRILGPAFRRNRLRTQVAPVGARRGGLG
ncbi:MAG: class I SAM-dependent methyltransferase [Burkholderiaceae bacterium]